MQPLIQTLMDIHVKGLNGPSYPILCLSVVLTLHCHDSKSMRQAAFILLFLPLTPPLETTPQRPSTQKEVVRSFYLLWLPDGLVWVVLRRRLTLKTQGILLWRLLNSHVVRRARLKLGVA